MQITDFALAASVVASCVPLCAAQTPFGLPTIAGDSSFNEWVALGDLNGDGRLDWVCTDVSGPKLNFALSKGRGLFGPRQTLTFPSFTLAADVAVADVDGDSDTDIVAAGAAGSGSQLAVFPNQGDGTFGSAQLYATGPNCRAIALGDLDGDGRLDLVAAHEPYPGAIDVRLGIGGGTFGPAATYTTTQQVATPSDIALADMNLDGRLDVVLPRGVCVMYGNGSGQLGAPTLHTGPGGVAPAIVVADWNDDARPDVAVANAATVEVYKSNGTSWSSTPVVLSGPGNTIVDLAVSDVDGDGRLDVIASEYASAVCWWRALGGGAFGIKQRFQAYCKYGFAAADIDGDHRLDIVVPRSVASEPDVAVFTGNGAGAWGQGSSFDMPNGMSDIATGDLDLDGAPDVVAVNTSSGPTLYVRRGDGNAGFLSTSTFPAGAQSRAIALGRLNADTALDVVVRGEDGWLRVLLGNGAAGFGTPYAVSPVCNGVGAALAIGDVTSDGWSDIVWTEECAGMPYLNVLPGDGAGSFSTVQRFSCPYLDNGLALADVNGDARTDIVCVGNGSGRSWLANGSGTFTSVSFMSAATVRNLRCARIDSDNQLDLVVASHGSGLRLQHGNGDGTFAAEQGFGPSAAENVEAADFDGDGDVDVALLTNASIACFAGNGTITPTPLGNVPLAATGGIRLRAVDLDGNARVDLLVAHYFAIAAYRSDDLTAMPVSYCTAKTTSNGCVPAIGSSGTPSASATSGFTVTCTSAINQKNGLLFYSLAGRRAVPFQGGTMCVIAPVARTPLRGSGGNPPPNDCSGVFALDMNSYAHGLAGGSPQPALLIQGTAVTAQWWGRDPASSAPTMLSNAIEFLVGP